jgi:DNA polymerase III delta prime subunit
MVEKTQKLNHNWPAAAATQLTKTLDGFLANESMPQAYLFLGSSSEGSSAREVVQTFATKITGATFPNVDTLIYDAAEGTGIDGIREVLQLGALTPVASSRKVVIMFNMDLASPQMMNALLKTLEEPAAHATYLLLSSRPLLPTIMSRCQVFSLQGSGHTEVRVAKSSELTEALLLLQSHRTAGQAERMVLVNELAALEDDLLPQVIETWLHQQEKELKTTPHKYSAVRSTMETLQSLRGNFNKKMVLQQFVTSGLI